MQFTREYLQQTIAVERDLILNSIDMSLISCLVCMLWGFCCYSLKNDIKTSNV